MHSYIYTNAKYKHHTKHLLIQSTHELEMNFYLKENLYPYFSSDDNGVTEVLELSKFNFSLLPRKTKCLNRCIDRLNTIARQDIKCVCSKISMSKYIIFAGDNFKSECTQ